MIAFDSDATLGQRIHSFFREALGFAIEAQSAKHDNS